MHELLITMNLKIQKKLGFSNYDDLVRKKSDFSNQNKGKKNLPHFRTNIAHDR